MRKAKIPIRSDALRLGANDVPAPNHIFGVPIWKASPPHCVRFGSANYQRDPNKSSEPTKSVLRFWLGFDRDSSTLTWAFPAVASQRRHKLNRETVIVWL